MYVKIKVFISIFFLTCSILNAQNKINFGVGTNVGYKSILGSTGFLASCQFYNQASVHIGFAGTNFEGIGYGAGINYYLFKKIEWQPFFGVNYLFLSGKRFYVGEKEINRSYYTIPKDEFVLANIGVRKKLRFDDPKYKSFISLLFNLNYRYSKKNNAVILTSGITDYERERKLNNKLGSGFGGSITIIFYFAKKTSVDEG